MILVLQGGITSQLTMQPGLGHYKGHGCQVWGQDTQPTLGNKQGSLWLLRSTTPELDSLASLA